MALTEGALMSNYQEAIAGKLITIIHEIKKTLPKTRELSLVVTKLEEAVHWLAADETAKDMAKDLLDTKGLDRYPVEAFEKAVKIFEEAGKLLQTKLAQKQAQTNQGPEKAAP
jgi:hypothetical protein